MLLNSTENFRNAGQISNIMLQKFTAYVVIIPKD